MSLAFHWFLPTSGDRQTYQRLSGGRLLVNVVADGEDAEHRRFGDFLSQDER